MLIDSISALTSLKRQASCPMQVSAKVSWQPGTGFAVANSYLDSGPRVRVGTRFGAPELTVAPSLPGGVERGDGLGASRDRTRACGEYLAIEWR